MPIAPTRKWPIRAKPLFHRCAAKVKSLGLLWLVLNPPPGPSDHIVANPVVIELKDILGEEQLHDAGVEDAFDLILIVGYILLVHVVEP